MIKITDQPDAVYADRVNEERWVLPGPFELFVQPAALQTPRSKFLDMSAVIDLEVFSPAKLRFDSLQKTRFIEANLSYAFDFGPEKSPIFPGFRDLSKSSDLEIEGPIKPFIRKGPDSLIRDGIKGVTRIRIPIENGRWRVSIWTEDTGEWE
ncbi:MAG: hypothetical protein R3261_10220, partial [Alphaproteobacteria bacterium]|nr:hypothetical protein [Alphaproteobacteria bacterium]